MLLSKRIQDFKWFHTVDIINKDRDESALELFNTLHNKLLMAPSFYGTKEFSWSP